MMTMGRTADLDREGLVRLAAAAREAAYAPYSRYQVGAALLAGSGEVYTGCNVENAAYSPTICAERAAVAKAVCDGEREFTALAVVTEDGAAPCGVCRQVLSEFADEMIVVIADAEGNTRETTLKQLLPDSFSGPA
jgi:cytidine deaminase